MTTLLKTGRTLQLHNPAVLDTLHPGLEQDLPSEGTATYHPPSRSLIVRCAEDTYLSVPQVCLSPTCTAVPP